MSDQPLSLPAKQAALEILALIQRTNEDDDMLVTQIAEKVKAIVEASDAQLGLLRHVAQILTPAANAEDSGAAIAQAVEALREAGISDDEP